MPIRNPKDVAIGIVSQLITPLIDYVRHHQEDHRALAQLAYDIKTIANPFGPWFSDEKQRPWLNRIRYCDAVLETNWLPHLNAVDYANIRISLYLTLDLFAQSLIENQQMVAMHFNYLVKVGLFTHALNQQGYVIPLSAPATPTDPVVIVDQAPVIASAPPLLPSISDAPPPYEFEDTECTALLGSSQRQSGSLNSNGSLPPPYQADAYNVPDFRTPRDTSLPSYPIAGTTTAQYPLNWVYDGGSHLIYSYDRDNEIKQRWVQMARIARDHNRLAHFLNMLDQLGLIDIRAYALDGLDDPGQIKDFILEFGSLAHWLRSLNQELPKEMIYFDIMYVCSRMPYFDVFFSARSNGRSFVLAQLFPSPETAIRYYFCTDAYKQPRQRGALPLKWYQQHDNQRTMLAFIWLFGNVLVLGAYGLWKCYKSIKSIRRKPIKGIFRVGSTVTASVFLAMKCVALGAAVGSALPGIGTAAGAVIGGIVGACIAAGITAYLSKQIGRFVSFLFHRDACVPTNPQKYRPAVDIRPELNACYIDNGFRKLRKAKRALPFLAIRERQRFNRYLDELKLLKRDEMEIDGMLQKFY